MTTDPILDAPRNVQELHRHKDTQRATWKVQRVGWWVLALISLSGILGVLGDGPLATTTAHSGSAAVRYDLILRRDGDALVTFDATAQRGRSVVSLPSGFMDTVEIADLQPEPIASFSGPDGQSFVFAAPHGRTRVTMKIRPRQIGPLEFRPRVNGQPLPTRVPFVLP